MQKQFRMINEDFTCVVCGEYVPRGIETARNHCPSCLHSVHLDINPGDRACECEGILKPIRIEPARRDRLRIIYKCEKCNQIKRNLAARDDNYDLILKIMKENSEKLTKM